jgi:hypothetical protein
VKPVGRALTADEVDSYDVLPKYLARKVRVYSVPALPGGFDGMTIGSNIFLRSRVAVDGTSTLLAHELVHVRQWAELGPVGFSYRYVRSFLAGLIDHRSWMRAYRSIDAEEQARFEATDWLRRRTQRTTQPGRSPETGDPTA